MKKKDKVYYARILPDTGIYDVLDLTVRTVEDDYFVGTDEKTMHAHLFNMSELGVNVFTSRSDALAKVKEAEKHKKVVSDEKYYEEY